MIIFEKLSIFRLNISITFAEVSYKSDTHLLALGVYQMMSFVA